jgi:hypothetical protein
MTLFIAKTNLTEDVRKIFSACYPYLKIEFYKRPSADYETLIKKKNIAFNFSEQQFVNDKTGIDINRNVTVEELENKFASIGLIAEVFRRSGNVWIETSLTNNWTLQQQNTAGEEISRYFTIS